ncbi:hypothetical protein K2173_026694 [Erythroxylum novogranatense]|uniref:F-box domain-containing protein n=1 Tax=Erythroxylum novogranatense TaxID=1862640 RepID=A0AAV8TWT7_9ROSI|nr:hypothetical protein K2173_026694 [Erythroxylum novogranatense]
MGAGLSGSNPQNGNYYEGSSSYSSRQGLDDVPENCVSSIYMYLDPPEICKLARLNRTFHGASLADFVWEAKLPSNYKFLVERVLHETAENLSKKEIFARFSRPNCFDGGTKQVWLDKSSGKMNMLISYKALRITVIDDRRYWNHISTEESRFHTIAYLKQTWWFEVVGELEFEFPPGTYSLFFRLQLGKATNKRFGRRVRNIDQVHGWDIKPVRFEVSTSNGQRSISECYLREHENWVHYHAGDFVVDNLNKPVKIKFSMMQIDCTHTKGGLCLDSVLICPIMENSVAKQLFLKIFPEATSITRAIEVDNLIEPVDVELGDCKKWESLKRNHRVYALLARGLTRVQTGCMAEAISASSTDHYPEESIQNTLLPSDGFMHGASYWSSKGQSDQIVPETLVYRLTSNLCLISEIRVQPFQAYFQYGFPMYRSKSVRFRFGFPKVPLELSDHYMAHSRVGHELIDDKIFWMYTSPEYPMAQENCLQAFKLPEPVLCIGGFVKVELLGRVQRQDIDGLYYICVSQVQVLGRPLTQPFDVEILYPSRKCMLKYHPQKESCSFPGSQNVHSRVISRWYRMTRRLVERGVRGW